MVRKLAFILMVVLFTGADTTPDNDPHASFKFLEIKARAEQSTRDFNPGFVSAFYNARVYAIRDYEMVDSLRKDSLKTAAVIKRVAGYLPANGSEGPFQVIFLAAQKGHGTTRLDTVYKYGMKSPLYTRRENGLEQGIFQIKEGSFVIPLPDIQNITRIVLQDKGGKKLESDFR